MSALVAATNAAGGTLPYDRVSLQAVTRRFGRTRALSGVALEFQAGTVTALLGPNGAGKSTLLSILATLLRPSAGEVRYGAVPHEVAARAFRGTIGLLGHDSSLYGELSAQENLIFFARIYGLADPEGRARALLERFGLDPVAGQPARTLSRGTRQRLGLARTLLHAPHLLLLDEPFSGLDPWAVELTRAILTERRDAGGIVVLVTHDLDAAQGLCDHVAVLRAGRIALDARPASPPTLGDLKEMYRDATA